MHIEAGGDASAGRMAASPEMRKYPAALIHRGGATMEVYARRNNFEGAVREPERRWAPCASAVGVAARRWASHQDGEGHEAVVSASQRRRTAAVLEEPLTRKPKLRTEALVDTNTKASA
ncbi:hypothetical protein D1007_45867 [Hordeum vulgare]|nr:hypothetical protein D1007_45867 [Hordeum vulgare]